MAFYLGFILGTGYPCGHYRGVVTVSDTADLDKVQLMAI